MSTRLLLIAHAETSSTRRATFARDEGLEARGLATARALRGTLPRSRETRTSPARAARETAVALGCDAQIDDALRDLDVGAWSGRTLADVAATDPESAAAWIADPAHAGHRGESIDALVRRMREWLARRREADGVTIAVTHAAVVRGAFVAALGAPGSAFWHVDVAPLGRLTLGTDGRRWSIRALETPRHPTTSALRVSRRSHGP